MIEVTKVIEWDMGHRVPNHKNKCRNPHGHRYRLELTVRGEINNQAGSSNEGMVVDFGDIKEVMLTRIHNILDHGFMIFEGDDFIRTCDPSTQFVVVSFIPTAENIVRWCADRLATSFPPSVTIARLRLYETPNSWADYTPTV